MNKRITKWKCDGFRSVVNPEGSFDPGKHFAEVAARRYYGRKGEVGALKLDSRTEDGRFSYYSAFIGRWNNGCMNGHNIMFIVEFDEEA